MDAGRRWALEIFGQYGPLVREQIAEMVKAEHLASADAQEASGHRSQGVYGEFWRGIMEKFEQLGDLPGAALVRPGEAPYKLAVVNGVAIFPWRFARSRETELTSTPFGTSGARVAAFKLRASVQESLDLNVPDAGLSDEDREILSTFQNATADPVVSSGRLVLIAISSSPRGLFSAEWGEVSLNAAGCLDWAGFHESLLSLPESKPVSTSPTGSFTTGEVPPKFPQAKPQQEADNRTDE